MRIIKLAIVSCLCFIATTSHAQWELGTNLYTTAPIGELAKQHFTWGYALDLTVLTPSFLPAESKTKWQIGLHIGGGDNGNKSFKTNSQFDKGSLYYYNCLVSHQLTSRWTFDVHPRFNVFTEAIVGHSRIHSGINETTETDNSDEYGHTRLYSTRSFRYGGALGASYKVNHMLKLDLRVAYTEGGAARYVDMSTVRKTEDGYLFDSRFSNESDLLSIHFGTSWLLSPKK